MDDAESGAGVAPGSLPTGFESAIAESAISESAPAPAAAAPLPRPLLALAVFIFFLAGVAWFVRTQPPARPANVPGDAVWVDGVWISCQAGGRATEWECLVFSDTGTLLHSGIYRGRIGTASKPHIIDYCDSRLGTIEGVFLQEIPPTPMAATQAGADTLGGLSPPFWSGCVIPADTSAYTFIETLADTVTPTDTIIIAPPRSRTEWIPPRSWRSSQPRIIGSRRAKRNSPMERSSPRAAGMLCQISTSRSGIISCPKRSNAAPGKKPSSSSC